MLHLTAPPAVHFLALAVVLSCVAAFCDWRTGHIPNWLTLGGVLLGLVAHSVTGFATQGSAGLAAGAAHSLLGIMATAAVPLVLYRCGGIGGGDVKLLAAMGAFCCTSRGVEIELYAFIIAAVYASAHLAYHGALLRTASSSVVLLLSAFVPRLRRRPASKERFSEMRFGPAVFAGACCAVCLQPGSPW